MKRLYVADITVLGFILCLFFTVGLDIARPRVDAPAAIYVVEVEGNDKTLDITPGTVFSIDGKFEVRPTRSEGGRFTFEAEGINTDAGILFFGEKYLGCNQPLKMYADGITFKGRVTKISQK